MKNSILLLVIIAVLMPAGIKAVPDTAWTKTLPEKQYISDAFFSNNDSIVVCYIVVDDFDNDTSYFANFNSYTGEFIRKTTINSDYGYPLIMSKPFTDSLIVFYTQYYYYQPGQYVKDRMLKILNFYTGEIVDSLVPTQVDDDWDWDKYDVVSLDFGPKNEKLYMQVDVFTHNDPGGNAQYDRYLYIWNVEDWTIDRRVIFVNDRGGFQVAPNNRYYSFGMTDEVDSESRFRLIFDEITTDTILYSLHYDDTTDYYWVDYPKEDTTKLLVSYYDRQEEKRKLQIRSQTDFSIIKTITNDTLQYITDINITNDGRYLIFSGGSNNILPGHIMIFDLNNEEIVYIYSELYTHFLGESGDIIHVISNNSELIFDTGTRENYMLNAKYTTTSIMNENDEPNSAIYPNPAGDYIDVMLSGAKEPVHNVKIYNVLGNVVYTPPDPLLIEGENIRLDVSGLAAGVYFVRVGDKMYKFVKM